MKIKCPQCDASLRLASPNQTGKQISCPRCRVVVDVPEDAKLQFDEVKSYKKVRCNGCQSKLRVKPELIGESIRCPLCDKRIRTPAPELKLDPLQSRSKPEFVTAMALESDSDHLSNSDFLDAVAISDLPPPLAKEFGLHDEELQDSVTTTTPEHGNDFSEESPESHSSFLRPVNSEPKTPGQTHSKAPNRRNWILAPLMIAVASIISIVILGTLAYLFFSRGGKLEKPSSKTQSSHLQAAPKLSDLPTIRF